MALLSHICEMPRVQAVYHDSRWTFSTCGSRVWFFLLRLHFQRKTAPVFEQEKTSGCTLANHVISERIYPNKARSNTIPLWLPDGFCIIHLDPYNNTGSLGAIFRFPRFPRRDATLSGLAAPLTQCRCYLHKQTWPSLVSDS